MQSTFSRQVKEKGHRVRAMGVLSAAEHIFDEAAMHTRTQASNRLARANRASHAWCKSEGKGKSEENKGKSKGKSKGKPKVRTKVPKAYTRAKHRKLVSQVLKLEIGDKLGNSGICIDVCH